MSNMENERNRLRDRNYHGTLGFNLNYDGSAKEQESFYNKPLLRSEDPPSLFFGYSNEVSKKQARHGPGIEMSLFSDAVENIEKKRVLQKEMASFEIVQKLERERRREAEKASVLEDRNHIWPFQPKRNSLALKNNAISSAETQVYKHDNLFSKTIIRPGC
ncbi:hypothetical protein BC829DRAFT_51017 [Chytridium lagenaria]|nr:hypothetical protein BC829DRAFT_51017 [Chytridium lagenaria]